MTNVVELVIGNDLKLSEQVYILKADEIRQLLRRLTPAIIAVKNDPTEVEREILFKSLARGYMKMPDIKMYPSC